MAFDETLAKRVCDRFRALGVAVTEKRMMGELCLFQGRVHLPLGSVKVPGGFRDRTRVLADHFDDHPDGKTGPRQVSPRRTGTRGRLG